MEFEIINRYCQRNKMTIPELSEKIGMSKAGLYASLKNKTLSVSNLEKIAEVLDVPVTAFFDSQSENWNNKDLTLEIVRLSLKYENLEINVSHLKEIIRSKRALLRLVYAQLQGTSESSFDQLLKAINDSEKFEIEKDTK